MHSAHLATIADRKALLVTRAQLDRARMTLAVHEIKAIVCPAPGAARSAALRPTAAMIVGFAAPLLGMTPLRALGALRIAGADRLAHRQSCRIGRNSEPGFARHPGPTVRRVTAPARPTARPRAP